MAFFVIILTGVAALTIDTGLYYLHRTRIKTALESAALAAGRELVLNENATGMANAKTAATVYAAQNKLVLSDTDIAVTYVDSRRWVITIKKKVSSTHAPFMSMFMAKLSGEQATMEMPEFQVSVGIETQMLPDAFKHAVFSGSDENPLEINLDITSGGMTITGDVHSNQSMKFKGANNNIYGKLNVVGDVMNTNDTNKVMGEIIADGNPNVNKDADPISMPEFDIDEFKAQAQAAGTYYSGNKDYSGQTINLNGIVFVEGDVKLSGSNISGSGTIISTGQIQISGHINYSSGESFLALVTTMSGDKAVKISASSSSIAGHIYAPNGEIEISGAKNVITGGLIGDSVDLSGSQTKVDFVMPSGLPPQLMDWDVSLLE